MLSDVPSYAEIIAVLLAIGGIGGFLSGLLGVGGGVIFVPALFFAMKSYGVDMNVGMHMAVATSLALILVTGATSAFFHHKKGSVDVSLIKAWSPAIALGVAAGTYLAAAVSGAALKQLFSILLLLVCLYMIVSKEPGENSRPHKLSMTVQRGVAALIGGLAALLGVGGAVLTIPFMAYLGVPMRKAVGTGGALAFVIAFPGIFGYIIAGLKHAEGLPPYSLGYVNLFVLAMIAPMAMLLSPAGVHVSHNLPRSALRRIFAGVVILVSLRMFLS